MMARWSTTLVLALALAGTYGNLSRAQDMEMVMDMDNMTNATNATDAMPEDGGRRRLFK